MEELEGGGGGEREGYVRKASGSDFVTLASNLLKESKETCR
jgi:hypothetical protein